MQLVSVVIISFSFFFLLLKSTMVVMKLKWEESFHDSFDLMPWNQSTLKKKERLVTAMTGHFLNFAIISFVIRSLFNESISGSSKLLIIVRSFKKWFRLEFGLSFFAPDFLIWGTLTLTLMALQDLGSYCRSYRRLPFDSIESHPLPISYPQAFGILPYVVRPPFPRPPRRSHSILRRGVASTYPTHTEIGCIKKLYS